MERNNSIDFLKGISMYLVVVNHLANQIIGTNVYTQVISLVHLPMLFVISGYLFNITWKNKSLKRVIIQKVKRLLLPYISWSTIALLFSIIINFNSSIVYIRNEFIQIFIYGRSVWFLLVLFIITILSSIFLKKFKKNIYLHPIVYFILCYIILCYILPNEVFQLIKMKVYLFYFMLGVFGAEYKDVNKKIYMQVKKIIYMLFFLFIAGSIFFVRSEQANYMVDFVVKNDNKYMIVIAYILTVLGICILIYISDLKIPCRIKDIFQRMGICSLDIYVIHMFLVKIIGVILLTLIDVEIIRNILIFILGFIISYLIVILKERLLKKIKIYRWINGEW